VQRDGDGKACCGFDISSNSSESIGLLRAFIANL